MIQPPKIDSERIEMSEILKQSVANLESHALELLRKLIRTESVTGYEGTHNDSSSISGVLWDALGEEQFVNRVYQRVEADRENIIASVFGHPGHTFVLDAHVDTVPRGEPAQWFTGNPLAALDGNVDYLGENRVRLSVGDQQVER